MAAALLVLIIGYRKRSAKVEKADDTTYPYEARIVDAGSESDDLLARVKSIYANIYGVPISSINEKTRLGTRFGEITSNVAFHLGIAVGGGPGTTIGEMLRNRI